MIIELLGGFVAGLKVTDSLKKTKIVRDAYELAKQSRFNDALNFMGEINVSPEDKKAVTVVAYYLKACCYIELEEKGAALHCINVLKEMKLSKPSWIAPSYNKALKEVKPEIEKLINDYDL